MQEAHIDELTDRDFRGPDGSRYSNWHLFHETIAAGHVFTSRLEVVDEEPSSIGLTEIQVFQDETYSGNTHEWRLVHSVNPWELNQPVPKVVTLYMSEWAHQGPEEGGWGWTFHHVLGTILIDNPYSRESIAEAEAAAELLCAIWMQEEGLFDERYRYRNQSDVNVYAETENVFAHRHSVGSVYYC